MGDHVLQVAGRSDGSAVHFGNDVAFFDSCFFGCGVLVDVADIRAGRNAVVMSVVIGNCHTGDAEVCISVTFFDGIGFFAVLVFFFIRFFSVCDVGEDRFSLADRNSIAHAFNGGACIFCAVDADQLAAHVKKGAAGIARVDCSVGLDEPFACFDLAVIVIARDFTVEGADDTAGC